MTEAPVTEVKEKKAKATKPKYEGPACSVCGKPLTDPESIKQGIGPLCRAMGWTKEKVAERMAQLKVDNVPEGWIKIADMHKQLNVLKIPVARMVRAIGGDRAMEQPLNSDFAVVYFGRTRYISPAAMSEANLTLLRDKNLGVPQPEKPKKEPKPKKEKAAKAEKKADGKGVVNPDAFNQAQQTAQTAAVETFIEDVK